MEVGIFERLVFIFELINIDIKLRELCRIQRAHGDMFDSAFVSALAVEPNAFDVGFSRLHQVENITFGIMGAVVGEGPVRRPLDDPRKSSSG